MLTAPNLPKNLVKQAEEADKSESSSKSADGKIGFDEILKVSRKYEKEQEKNKKRRPPTIKEIREKLQHMVNFSEDRNREELASKYSLEFDNEKDEKSDASGDEGGPLDKNNLDTKKVGDYLFKTNVARPPHRR